MRRLLTRVLLTGAMVLSGVIGVAASASAAPTPAASVSLDGTGVIGRFDSAVISGKLRCRDGSVEPELVVSVYQGSEAGTHAISDITCDGAWHRFSIEMLTDPLGGPFVPGETWVDARLTVHEPVMHDPLPQGHDANAVWLRPNVKVSAVWPLVLGRDGNMRVTVDAVCRGPWAAESISVQLLQGPDSQVDGSSYLSYPDVPCDGQRHRLTIVVDPAPGTQFRVTRTTVGLGMLIWDEAWTGDPINGYSWEGQVGVVRR